MKNNTGKYVVIGVLIGMVIAAVIGGAFVLGKRSAQVPVAETTTFSVQSEEEKNTTKISHDTEIKTTKPAVTAPPTTAKPVTQAPVTVIVHDNGGEIGYVSYQTPGDAGINLRSRPSSTSDKLAILPEGYEVTVLDHSDAKGTGYLYCSVKISGKTYKGYLMAQYVTTDGYLRMY